MTKKGGKTDQKNPAYLFERVFFDFQTDFDMGVLGKGKQDFTLEMGFLIKETYSLWVSFS